MANNTIQDASWDLVNSTREANQLLADTTVTILDPNLKFEHTAYFSGRELLERETDDLQNLTREWGQQVHKQQAAFQQLANGTMEISLNFLRSWFSFPQLVWGATRSAVDREFQLAQEGAQRVQEHRQ